MGHSRSLAVSPFDRAHTTFYSTLIETMRLSCRLPFSRFSRTPTCVRRTDGRTDGHTAMASTADA